VHVEVPQREHAHREQHAEPDQDAPAEAGKEDDVEARRRHQRGGAQIGLPQNQAHRHGEQQRGKDEIAQAQRRLVLVEVPRQHQRQRELHHLRGLEAGDADVQPAARAVHHVAEQGHPDEEGEADGIGGHRQAHQGLRRDLRRDPHRAQGDAEAHHLVHQARRVLGGGRVQRGEAERGQGQQQHQQRLVDALGEPQADAAQRKGRLQRH
jgi:hypothetical protein